MPAQLHALPSCAFLFLFSANFALETTPTVALQCGATTEVMAGDTQGNFFSSFPLAEDGNFKFFLYTDPYKATISKSTGEDVEEDVYEAYYLGLLLSGKKGEIPDGHTIRIGGEKYMWLRALAQETYIAKVKDADGNETDHKVTIPEVHVMKKGSVQLFCGVKSGYFFLVKTQSKGMGDTGADAVSHCAESPLFSLFFFSFAFFYPPSFPLISPTLIIFSNTARCYGNRFLLGVRGRPVGIYFLVFNLTCRPVLA